VQALRIDGVTGFGIGQFSPTLKTDLSNAHLQAMGMTQPTHPNYLQPTLIQSYRSRVDIKIHNIKALFSLKLRRFLFNEQLQKIVTSYLGLESRFFAASWVHTVPESGEQQTHRDLSLGAGKVLVLFLYTLPIDGSITTYFYKGTHVLTDEQLVLPASRVAAQLPASTACSIHDTALLHYGAANSTVRGTGFHTHLLNISFCSRDCYEDKANMRIIEESYEPKAEFVFLSFDHLRAD
jgi:hypothetical protein